MRGSGWWGMDKVRDRDDRPVRHHQMLHRLANRAQDLLYLPGLERFWLRRLRGRVLCLLYHRVGQPDRFPFLTWGGSPVITPDDLYRELACLRDAGVRFLVFGDLLRGEFPGPDEVGVIVSFDDGFRDVYGAGLAILDRLDIKGTVFQTTAMIQGVGSLTAGPPLRRGGTCQAEQDQRKPAHLSAPSGGDENLRLLWEHELYWLAYHPETFAHLKGLATEMLAGCPTGLSSKGLVDWLRDNVSPPRIEALLARVRNDLGTAETAAETAAELGVDLYPNVADIQAAARRGHEIGSHGHRHYPRERITTSLFEVELQTSAAILEAILGRRATCFSYPFNSFLPGDEAIAARYYNQVATVEGRPITPGDDRLRLPRCTWPGQQPNALRRRRWLLTGRV